MANQSDPFIALGFFAAAFAAVFAGWQAWISHDTEQRSLRAYVGLADFTNTPPQLDKERIRIQMVNYGQTAAKNVEFYGNWEFVAANVLRLPDDFTFPEKPYCPDNQRLYGGATIFPQKSLESQRAHCPEEIAKLISGGQWNSFFYGHVDYQDIFDQKWTTTYCVGFLNGLTILCDRHNEIDVKESNNFSNRFHKRLFWSLF
jgi:hypothetical protein